MRAPDQNEEKDKRTIITRDVIGDLIEPLFALNTYTLITKTNQRFTIQRCNFGIHELRSQVVDEVIFELFQQPKGSSWIQRDLLTYQSSSVADILHLDPPW